MGDYPYPSTYMLNGHGELPAFPMRAACKHLAAELTEPEELLAGLSAAVGVFYNYSRDLPCFNFSSGPNKETDAVNNLWGFQSCTEMIMPFSRDGGRLQLGQQTGALPQRYMPLGTVASTALSNLWSC